MRSSISVAVAMVAALFFASFTPIHPPHPSKIASSMVYVAIGDEGAHGSGVHIGNGLVLTAAHVADDPEVKGDLSIVDSLGAKHSVETLWVNHKYDVALLRMTDPKKVNESEVSCRYLNLGEKLSFSGNPLDLHNITTFGNIADPEIMQVGPWAEVYTVSAQLAPGMSGGPAFDKDGYVVGINVGLIATKAGNYALSFIVPGRTVCHLLGR